MTLRFRQRISQSNKYRVLCIFFSRSILCLLWTTWNSDKISFTDAVARHVSVWPVLSWQSPSQPCVLLSSCCNWIYGSMPPCHPHRDSPIHIYVLLFLWYVGLLNSITNIINVFLCVYVCYWITSQQLKRSELARYDHLIWSEDPPFSILGNFTLCFLIERLFMHSALTIKNKIIK